MIAPVGPAPAAEPAPPVPVAFRHAIEVLAAADVRPEIELAALPAPTRLAPFTHAVGATVRVGGDHEVASGRFVLLHDPLGQDAWGGTMRVVIFVTAELELEIARDPLMPEVAWSWLTDALSDTAADFSALGGTVTATSSTRFGDIQGPERTDDLELRASWTADTHVGVHLHAFASLLAAAAGLPPEGVASLGGNFPPNAR